MPQIKITAGAAHGLERCRRFLAEKNPLAARRAADTIKYHLNLLASHPDMGRPFEEQPELRELLIPFGAAGYVALYRYLPNEDNVFILAFRHQKEVGIS